MRPLLLEIHAFGPFAGSESVDFASVAADRPFLIGGPTGAGKSSVLDAMTYALYGNICDVSGPRTSLRSDHAEPTAECRVRFTFEARGERWRVTRTPKQFRLGPRSSKMAWKDPTALLEAWRGGQWCPVESRIQAIDKRMICTVGLTMDQFSKVAILPQGRFEQVLNAGTSERTELLRSLFGTEVFRAAVSRIESDRRELRSETARRATAVQTQRAGALERIDGLAGRLLVAIGEQDPPGAASSNVIDLAERSGRVEAPSGADDTITDGELRTALEVLRKGPLVTLLEQMDEARANATAAAERLAEAASHAALLAERDEQLAERRALDVSVAQRSSRAALVEAHDAARQVHGVLERSDATRDEHRRHATQVRSLLEDLGPLLRRPRLGFAPDVVTRLLEASEPGASELERDPGSIQGHAEAAERHALRMVVEFEEMASESQRLSELTARHETLAQERESNLAEAARATKRREELAERRQVLEQDRDEAEELASRAEALAGRLQACTAVAEWRHRLDRIAEALERNESRRAELSERIDGLDAEAAGLDADIEGLTREAAQADSLDTRISEVSGLLHAVRERDSRRTALAESARALERAEVALDAVLAGFVEGTAATLAESLSAGEPCPVCGSAEHPAPAEPLANSPVAESDVDTARAVTEEARRSHDAARADLAELLEHHPGLRSADPVQLAEEQEQLLARLQLARDAERALGSRSTRRSELESLLGKLRSDLEELQREASRLEGASEAATNALGSDATESLEKLERRLATARQDHGRATAAAGRLVGLDEDLDVIHDESDRIESRRHELNNRNEVLTAEIVSIQIELDRLRSSLEQRLGDEDAAELATAAGESADRLSALRTALGALAASARSTADAELERERAIAQSCFPSTEAARAALLDGEELRAHKLWVEEWRRRDAVNTAELERLAGLELPAAPEELGPLQVRAELTRRAAEHLGDLAAWARGEVEGIEEMLDLALAGEADGESSAKRLALLEEVHGVLSGDRTTNRLAVEAWVLSSYLGEVVTAANVHLHSMTCGRFSLAVDSSSVAGTAKTGLDLEVLDADTGRSRPTRTLSGGETFQASLALALGFADVLTAEAAGLRLDALFVDEGFGTLDAESVDVVIEVLDGLRSRGAMVGLISHVEAMKEALPMVLEVAKRSDHRGSEIRQRVPA